MPQSESVPTIVPQIQTLVPRTLYEGIIMKIVPGHLKTQVTPVPKLVQMDTLPSLVQTIATGPREATTTASLPS